MNKETNIKKIGDLCDIRIGGTPSRSNYNYWDSGDNLWLSIADMSHSGKFIFETKEKITMKGVENSNVKLIPKNTLLFSFKLSIGKLAFAGSDMYTNEAIAGLVIKDEKILDKDYLYYFLSQMTFTDTTSAVKGKTLNKEKIKNLDIFLPPLSIQVEIVETLKHRFAKMNEIRELQQESIFNTQKILSQRLSEIFTKDNWKKEKFGNIFALNYGKGLDKNDRSVNGKYSVYGANGELAKSDKYLIDKKAIIIGRKGSAGEINKVNENFWPTDVTYYVLESDKYDLNFSYHLFKYLNFPKYAKGVKPGINRNEIYDISINMPDLNQQREISKELDILVDKINNLKKLQKSQLEDFKKLEKAYLKEAFNGELIK